MMNKEENEFLFDDKQTKKIMRRARFWSTVKMIGITLVVTPIVLIALWYGLRTLSLNSAQKVMDDIHLFNEISAPNVQISNQVYDDHLLGGKITTTTYKVLGEQHRPYIWKPIESDYNLFGTLTFTSFPSSIQIEGSESLAETHQFERFNDYTGDREMFFYHPKIAYNHYKDNISELNQLEKNTLVELAISFDNAYRFDDIKSKLPPEVQVDWWWVDAYTDDTLDFLSKDSIRLQLIIRTFTASNQSNPNQNPDVLQTTRLTPLFETLSYFVKARTLSGKQTRFIKL